VTGSIEHTAAHLDTPISSPTSQFSQLFLTTSSHYLQMDGQTDRMNTELELQAAYAISAKWSNNAY